MVSGHTNTRAFSDSSQIHQVVCSKPWLESEAPAFWGDLGIGYVLKLACAGQPSTTSKLTAAVMHQGADWWFPARVPWKHQTGGKVALAASGDKFCLGFQTFPSTGCLPLFHPLQEIQSTRDIKGVAKTPLRPGSSKRLFSGCPLITSSRCRSWKWSWRKTSGQCLHVYFYVCMHACMYVCMYVCMYTYIIYIYIYIYVCVHYILNIYYIEYIMILYIYILLYI